MAPTSERNPIKPSIAILGAGRSGRAARELALCLGQEPVVFDQSGGPWRDDFGPRVAAGFDAFVLSPGFAASHPWRIAAVASGRPCWSETAYAARHWAGRRLGVTGTNGKTTVTRLLAEALAAAGEQATACGNIGRPLSELAASEANEANHIAVMEISSFQAELPGDLQLDAFFWTNFAEDHLDRYSTMDDYFAAKARLFDCRRPGAPAFVGRGVLERLAASGAVPSDCHPVEPADALAAQLVPGSVFTRPPQRRNFDLVAAYWQAAGRPLAPLIEAASSFALSPHRLQLVAEREGVRFWDDSKATNFHAALAALEAMEGPVVWIGGGSAKGGDLEGFARALGERVGTAVLYGQFAGALAAALPGDRVDVHQRPEFTEAVECAAALAAAGAGRDVLLSPGFASFDQFSSCEERGKCFISIVLGL